MCQHNQSRPEKKKKLKRRFTTSQLATAIDNKTRHSVKAIGIPCISDEIERIQTARITEILGLANENIRRGKGPIDLLIGIDHAHMHTGPTKQVDHIVARKSPLG